jgi:hypothetical protein
MRQPGPMRIADIENPTVSKKRENMRTPAGLDTAGKALWRSVVEVFDLDEEPHKV